MIWTRCAQTVVFFLTLAFLPVSRGQADRDVWKDLTPQLSRNRDALPEGVTAWHLKTHTFSSPWSVEPIQQDWALVSQKSGEVLLVNLNRGEVQLIARLAEAAIRGQGGLLDLAVEQRNGTPSRIFATATVKDQGLFTTALFRADWPANLLSAHESRGRREAVKVSATKTAQQLRFEKIFTAKAHESGGHHFGSRIALVPPAALFLTIGDRGEREKAQNLNSHHGKILRLDRDGQAHKENPCLGRKDCLPEIWSFGHRNPQGIWWDDRTQRLWNNEHGPKGGDEVNQITSGGNYGWPLVTEGEEYGGGRIGQKSRPGMISPLYSYVPSIAPSALVRPGAKLVSGWDESFLTSALAQQHVNRLYRDKSGRWKEERFLRSLNERFRDIQVAESGQLYLITDAGKFIVLSAAEKSMP